jgi:hypothetical protein
MKLPWRKYVVLYETDIKRTRVARTTNDRSVWIRSSGIPTPVYLRGDGTWYDTEGYGYLGTWKPAPKWVPWWKRVKPLELNKKAKKEWQRSLDMNHVQSVGRETIWGVTPTGLLGALGAIILSGLVILVLWLILGLVM